LKYDEDEKPINISTEVPDIRNKTLKEGSKILEQLGLKYNTETTDFQNNSIIKEQFPLPGTKINRGQIIYLYVNN